MKMKILPTALAGTFAQFLAVLTGTMSSVSDGMNYGWSAPVMQYLKSNNTHIKVTEFDEIWLESIFLIGAISGVPIVMYFVDRLGRKRLMIMSAFISLISWILLAVGNNIIYIYIARYICGISSDVAFGATPMYIAEIAEKPIRGILSGIIYIMWLVGILIIYSVAPFVPFYASSIIGAILVLIQIIFFPLMPDSPYYLVSKGKEELARKNLMRLRSSDNVENEMKEIISAVSRQQSERGRPKDLILVKSNRKALTILVVLNGAQHFSSISVMLMNLHVILAEADSVYLSNELTGIIFGVLMLVAAILSDVVVDKFGRKSLVIVSSILSGLTLLVLAAYFTVLKNGYYDLSKVSWIPIVIVMLYAFTFKFGLGMIPIVLTAELFPTNIKAMGMATANFSYVFFAWISIEMYQRMVPLTGFDVPFYIFSGCCFLTAIYAFVCVPETKGKTLDEIQFILKGIDPPNQNSSSTTL